MEAARPPSNEATATAEGQKNMQDAQGWDMKGNYWDVEAARCAPGDWYEKPRYRGVKGLDASVV